jgi:hypothetical protein
MLDTRLEAAPSGGKWNSSAPDLGLAISRFVGVVGLCIMRNQ